MTTETLRLSSLPKTWILDVDGTLLPHNSHLGPEGDTLLPGVREFFAQISPDDVVILLTARNESFRQNLESFLVKEGIRFNFLLCGMPVGERILVNDRKPSGLTTAIALNKERNAPFDVQITIDHNL